MLNLIIWRTLEECTCFNVDDFSTIEKVVLPQEDLRVCPLSCSASDEQIKRAFDICLAQGDVKLVDKKNKTFSLNTSKKGMFEAVKKSQAYEEYVDSHPWVKKEKQQPLQTKSEYVRSDPFRKLMFGRSIGKILSFLRANGVNYQNEHGETAVYLAVLSLDPYLLERILKLKGIDVDLPPKSGSSPFMMAAMRGEIKIMETLLKAGADVGHKDKDGFDAFGTAAHEGNLEICQFLFREAKANPHTTVSDGKFPALSNAASGGFLELVHFLLDECHVEVDQKDDAGYTALLMAIKTGNLNIADVLLAHGADINSKTRDGETALILATHFNNEKAVAYALTHKCSINEQDSFSHTALHYAATTGYTNILNLLLQAGANTDIKNDKGFSAYDLAKINKRHECRKILLGIVGEQVSFCAKCDNQGTNMMVCSRCRCVKYCGKECQKADWKEHKKECKDKSELVQASRTSLDQHFTVDMTIYKKPNPSWTLVSKRTENGMYVEHEPTELWEVTRKNMPIIIPPEIEHAQIFVTCTEKNLCTNPEHVKFVRGNK
eukprot:Phypoly_transcript_03307.p1 GENE.Phypoly_transcript_03307~~Phypoly_transcript_03307.p1  ORF type:complete len:548 (-),score=82.99 Phypoly_transcript_03307:692-2335(-)